jgi:hypothetical protein
MNFSAMNASVLDQTVSLTWSSSILFEDMRNTSSDITISVTSTDFSSINATLASFSLTNLRIATDDTDAIGQVECDLNTGINVGFSTPSAFVDSNADGVSDAKNIVTSDVRARIGKYSIEPELSLTIPGGSTVTTYRTTLTYTIL